MIALTEKWDGVSGGFARTRARADAGVGPYNSLEMGQARGDAAVRP